MPPSITVSAPAAIAFAMSPDEVIPPSATSGTPCSEATCAQSKIAVSCGTPTPATTRVVQIPDGPTPTLIASAPASIRASAASPVAMLPAITCTSWAFFTCRTTSSTPSEWPCAVSTTSASTSASTSAAVRSSASGPTPTAAATRSRPRSSFVASGYASRFEMSLTVMSPFSRPSRSTIGSFSIRCRPRIACASSSVVPTGAVTRPSRVIASATRVVDGTPKRRSRFVRIPTSRSLVVDDRDPGDAVARHQVEGVADERVRREGDGLDDHPGLRALHLVDLRHLVGDREVPVQHAHPAEPRERDAHARLGDRVHRRRDERDLERDRARQPTGRRDVVREDCGLGRHEQDVVEGEAFLRELVLAVSQVG